MADMEIDLDVPSKGQARPASSKFLPRGSRPLPKPKVKKEPVSTQIQSKVEFEAKPPLQMELDAKPPLHVELEAKPPLHMEVEAKPPLDMDLEAKPPVQLKKDENADIGFSMTENDVVGMDVDTKEDMRAEQETEAYVDEVVNEIDVYFSPTIDDHTKLYVWQYPLRPLWRPYELDDRCKEVRVKPDSGEVEIDLAIDDGGQNYDHNKPADIKITKQTLSSSWNPPARTAYAIGVLAGNELHLNPVHAVVQLRPSLEHLKPGGAVKKNAGKGEGIVKVEQLTEERLPVSSAKQNKLPGESTEQAKDGQEQWLPMQYFGHGSNISASCLHKMLKKEDATIPFLMSSHDYIDSLCPGTSNNNVKDRGPFIRSLRSLPLDERFKAWFREGDAVSRFDTLKHLAMEESEDEILLVILKYARLVQGNWVAKSSLVYGKDTSLEVVVRDHVLAEFRKNLVFGGSKLPQKANLRKATTEVLNVFARSSGKDWKFATPPDMTFLKLYPHIQEQQEATWKKLEEQIDSVLKAPPPKKAAGPKS